MPLRPSLLAALVAVIWGVNFVVIDLGLDGVPPTLFVALRFVAVLLPAVLVVPRPRVPWRDVLLVGAFMSLGQFGLLYTSLALGMPAGLASLVLQAQVGLTVLLAAAALRERPTRGQVVGVLVGAAGLVVVGVGRQASTPALAVLVCLAAATSWATGNVVSRRAGAAARGREVSSPASRDLGARRGSGSRGGGAAGLSMTVWSALVVPVPMLALSLVVDGPATVGHALSHLGPASMLSTAYTAWLASLVGYGVWNALLARYPASAVVPWTMLVPPVGMAAAWLVLGERPNAAEVVGGSLLLAGVAVTTGVLRRRRATAPVDSDPGQELSGTSPGARTP